MSRSTPWTGKQLVCRERLCWTWSHSAKQWQHLRAGSQLSWSLVCSKLIKYHLSFWHPWLCWSTFAPQVCQYNHTTAPSLCLDRDYHFWVFCTLLAWRMANNLTFSCSIFLIYQVGITLPSEDCRRLNSLVMAGCSEVYGWQVPSKSKAHLKSKKSLIPSPAVCRGFSNS